MWAQIVCRLFGNDTFRSRDRDLFLVNLNKRERCGHNCLEVGVTKTAVLLRTYTSYIPHIYIHHIS